MVNQVSRHRPHLGSVFISLAFVATLLVGFGVGTDSRVAALPGDYCEGYVFHTNEGGKADAERSFAANCFHAKYNDQLGHKCSWKGSGYQGWQCEGKEGSYSLRADKAVTSPVGKSLEIWSRDRMIRAQGATPLSGSTVNVAQPSKGERLLAGRVFFTMLKDANAKPPKYVDSSCSGVVVDSLRKSTVWTAGHCLHVQGKWVSNVVFVPGYDNGRAPHGVWAAEDIWTTAAMARPHTSRVPETQKQLARENDVGVIKLKPLNGRKIEDVTGGLNFMFDYQVHLMDDDARILGYPGRGDMSACEADFLRLGAYGMNALMCPRLAAPGASGGPIIGYQNGRGFLAGVISRRFDSQFVYSSQFGQGASNLYIATDRK